VSGAASERVRQRLDRAQIPDPDIAQPRHPQS
jgi:hypothetical protein